MRIAVLAAVVGLAIGPLALRSASACPDLVLAGQDGKIVLAANGCGAGTHWVAAHRGPAGRWISGHCEPN